MYILDKIGEQVNRMRCYQPDTVISRQYHVYSSHFYTLYSILLN